MGKPEQETSQQQCKVSIDTAVQHCGVWSSGVGYIPTSRSTSISHVPRLMGTVVVDILVDIIHVCALWARCRVHVRV